MLLAMLPENHTKSQADTSSADHLRKLDDTLLFFMDFMNEYKDLFQGVRAIGFLRTPHTESMLVLRNNGSGFGITAGFSRRRRAVLPAQKPFEDLYKKHFLNLGDVDVITLDEAANAVLLTHRTELCEDFAFPMGPGREVGWLDRSGESTQGATAVRLAYIVGTIALSRSDLAQLLAETL